MTTFDTPFSTTEAYILSRLPEIRDRIAELRRHNCHVTAGIMRDELLCQLEAWIDPAGLEYRAELQSEQKASAGALALAIDDRCGF
jgi:hypothetical protein